MEREILFKAQRTDTKEWVFGYIARIHHSGEKGKIESYFFNALDELGWSYECVVSAETVCHYTSYADLRKKKAFEHDIIFYEDGDCYGHIVFKEGCFLIEWEEARPDLRIDIHFWFTERRVYVVGNVFHNPELLNQ